jgi:hypothetical protein
MVPHFGQRELQVLGHDRQVQRNEMERLQEPPASLVRAQMASSFSKASVKPYSMELMSP